MSSKLGAWNNSNFEVNVRSVHMNPEVGQSRVVRYREVGYRKSKLSRRLQILETVLCPIVREDVYKLESRIPEVVLLNIKHP